MRSRGLALSEPLEKRIIFWLNSRKIVIKVVANIWVFSVLALSEPLEKRTIFWLNSRKIVIKVVANIWGFFGNYFGLKLLS